MAPVQTGWVDAKTSARFLKALKLANRCRLCGNSDLFPILSLGRVPLANAFLDRADQKAETFPLDLVFCPHCTLVQITETLPPEMLFSEYLYFSSVSQTMLDHAREWAGHLVAERCLTDKSLVIEIGSNDGYMLNYFKRWRVPVLGIDPARNSAKVANAKGIPTLCAFFNDELAQTLPPADLVIANNVLGHVADLRGFVYGIKRILKKDGVAVFEVPYVLDMIERVEFDTIYHEHLCYFSLTALSKLFWQNGLCLAHAERVDIHGGSLRVTATHPDPFAPDKEATRLLALEQELDMNTIAYYRGFAEKVRALQTNLQTLLRHLKQNGATLVGYGAAAKGTVLLNTVGIGTDILDYVVDATPAKQGKYIPGVRVPIVAPEQLGKPAYILVLAWNFADEIMGKHPDFQGKWLLPLPHLELV